MSAITEVIGDLTIRTHREAEKYAALERVGGSLEAHAEGLQLPALTSVGGYLEACAEGLQLPALTSVGGLAVTMQPIFVTGLRWPVCILDAHMRIGCQQHSLDAWAAFTPREIAAMNGREGSKFWGQHGRELLARAAAAGRVFAMPALEGAA